MSQVNESSLKLISAPAVWPTKSDGSVDISQVAMMGVYDVDGQIGQLTGVDTVRQADGSGSITFNFAGLGDDSPFTRTQNFPAGAIPEKQSSSIKGPSPVGTNYGNDYTPASPADAQSGAAIDLSAITSALSGIKGAIDNGIIQMAAGYVAMQNAQLKAADAMGSFGHPLAGIVAGINSLNTSINNFDNKSGPQMLAAELGKIAKGEHLKDVGTILTGGLSGKLGTLFRIADRLDLIGTALSLAANNNSSTPAPSADLTALNDTMSKILEYLVAIVRYHDIQAGPSK